jgi:amino acid transporter
MIILGVGGAVGTGALFSSIGMAAVAGPAMIVSWVIGCVIYSFIGITYVDMSVRFPEAGGPARYSLYTHGWVANLINSVGSLVWYLLIPPIEAIATVTALSYFDSGFLNAKGDPTLSGAIVALALLVIYIPVNFYGVKMFARINNALGGIKIVLYLLLAIGFILVLGKASNFTAFGGFAPYGIGPIFAAVPIAMFSFGAIRVIPDFAEEAKDSRTLKVGIIYTLAAQFVIYVLFSVALVAGLSWGTLSVKVGEWTALTKVTANPFIAIAKGQGVDWLLVVAVVVGILGPGVAGYVYQGAGSRVLLAMARTGYVPQRLMEINARHRTPRISLIMVALIGAALALLAAPVPRIISLIDDAVVGGYISFAAVPVAMLAVRRQHGEEVNFRSTLIAALAFAGVSLVVYWSGWPAVPYAVVLVAIGSVVLGFSQRWKNLGHSLWYIAWILFLTLMSAIGSVGKGTEISFDLGSVLVIAVSVFVVLPWAVHSRMDADEVEQPGA